MHEMRTRRALHPRLDELPERCLPAPLGVATVPVVHPQDDHGLRDNITTDRTPRLVGKAPSGALVEVRAVGVNRAVRAGRDGTYSLGMPTLKVGEYSARARVAGVGGRAAGPWSAIGRFRVRDVPRVPTPPALTLDSDTGLKDDGVTTRRSPVLAGTAEPGTLVQVEGAGRTYFATPDNWGNYQVSFGNLPAGSYEVRARCLVAGLESAWSAASRLQVVELNTPTAPALFSWDDTGTAGDHATTVRRPTVYGFGLPGAVAEVRIDGRVAGSDQIDQFGYWSLQLPELAPGTYRVVARVNSGGDLGPSSPETALTIREIRPPFGSRSGPAAPTLRDYLDHVDSAGGSWSVGVDSGWKTSPSGSRKLIAFGGISKVQLADGVHHTARFTLTGRNESMWTPFTCRADLIFRDRSGTEIHRITRHLFVGKGSFSFFGTTPHTVSDSGEPIEVPGWLLDRCTSLEVRTEFTT